MKNLLVKHEIVKDSYIHRNIEYTKGGTVLKICHLTSAHNSSDIRIFVKECTSLASVGYEVYLVAQGELRVENSVNIIGIGSAPAGRRNRMTGFAKTIYETARSLDCDIYHFHDPELMPYALKLKKAGKKIIFDSHEDVPAQILDKEWIPYPLRKIISIVYKRYETYAVRQFDAVVAATPHIADAFKGRAKRIVVINNYPKLDDIEFHNKPFAERERIICYAGGINALRGENIMIEAMKDVNGQLIIAGDHKIEIIEGGKIKYVGFINRIKISELYNNARIGLCVLQPASNYINSQPIKMYEYMTAGLPYICSDFPAWKELTRITGAGICINPKDSKELAKAINLLLDDPVKSEKMGKNGRAAVLNHFSWNIEERKLLNLYKELID